MRSIQRRFNRESDSHPLWSSYVCFMVAIAGQNFTKRVKYFWFNILVEKEDYIESEKCQILKYVSKSGDP
jgi:hypothetical protein